MAVVIEALVKRGYRVGWRVLDAQYFGVPQRRRRVFIVGCLGDSGPSPAEILAISEGRAGYLEASNKKRQDTATATATSVGAYGESSFGQFREGVSTLKASGGVLGGGSETLLVH
jgi:DNA (cytosine-5)-methyltransferase 1